MNAFQFHPSLTQTHDSKTLAWMDSYQTATPNHKAVITFYLVKNETDSADVLRYKQQVESEILIALQTDDIAFDCVEVADIVLYCQNHEIETVLKMFERMVADYAFIWIDFQYLLDVLKNSKAIYFQQSHAVGKDSILQVTKKIFEKRNLPNAKAILTCAVVPSNTGFEEVGEMDTLMEKSLSNHVDFYHAVNFEDENDFWKKGEKGCWLGILFVN